MKQAALIALVAMLVAGCGSDGNGGENTSSSPTPSPTASELSAADTAACQKFTQAADKARDTISDAETKPLPIIIMGALLEVAQDDIDTAAGAASEELSGAMSQASGSLGLLIEKVDENNKGKLNNPVELNIAVEWAGAAESLDEVEVLCSV